MKCGANEKSLHAVVETGGHLFKISVEHYLRALALDSVERVLQDALVTRSILDGQARLQHLKSCAEGWTEQKAKVLPL